MSAKHGAHDPVEKRLEQLPDPDLSDADNPEWTEADFARAKPAADVLTPQVLAAFGRPRGRPKSDAPKVAVKLRLDPDVVEAFRATGAGWQTRMNLALRDAAGRLPDGS